VSHMVTFHHVNLGVPVDGLDTEATFLTDVIGYRRMQLDDDLRQLGASWFEADDGSQVHLSVDPDHRPAARAHVAVQFGAELATIERRLRDSAIEFESFSRPGFPRIVMCQDPSGNRWELRGE
jgi:catechol 2,3-dioxygenase-like lactoylglutathione lyase family enzyme